MGKGKEGSWKSLRVIKVRAGTGTALQRLFPLRKENGRRGGKPRNKGLIAAAGGRKLMDS